MKRICFQLYILCVFMVFGLFAQQTTEETVAARFIPSKTNPFRNEIFEITLEIITTGIDIGSEIGIKSLPPKEVLLLTGFEEMQPERSVQGNRLKSIRKFKTSARSPNAGTIVFSPTLELQIIRRRPSFFGSFWEENQAEIKTEKIIIETREVPFAGRPSSFSGGIGKFMFDVSVSSYNVATGEIIKIQYLIKGKGYMDPITAPEFPESAEFRSYPVKIIKSEENTRVFERIIIPISKNATNIPPCVFSYFDPEKENYISITQRFQQIKFHDQKIEKIEKYLPQESRTGEGIPVKSIAGESVRGKITLVVISAILIVGCALLLSVKGWKHKLVIIAIVFLLIIMTIYIPRLASPPFTITEETKARIAPSFSAEKTVIFQKGEKVWIKEEYRDWSRVISRNKMGWIPSKAVQK